LVRDVATGQGKHQLELTWHLGPALSPVCTKDNLFADGQDGLGLITVDGHGWSQSAHRGNWSAVYGRAERATVLTFASVTDLPAEFVTLLLTDASLQHSVGRLENWPGTASVHCYRYAREGQEHQFFFPNAEGAWSFGNWTSDARFLYWSWDRGRDLRLLVICGGSYAEIGGARVLMSESPVDYAEVVNAAGKTELFSSHPERVVLQESLDRIEMELAAMGSDLKGTGK
jgi:hypothetical protein